MKKFWLSILRAAGYFGIYLGSQSLVSTVYGMVLGVKTGMEVAQSGEMPPLQTMIEEMTAQLMAATDVLTVISTGLFLFVIVILFSVRRKNVFSEVGFKRVTPWNMLPLLLLGLSANIVLIWLLNKLPESMLQQYITYSAASLGNPSVLTWVATVVCAPLIEEIVFRGLIFGRLRQGMAPWFAGLITTVVFALMHVQWLWICYAALLGILLVYAAKKFKSIWASMAIHFAFNGFSMLLNSLNLSETASNIMVVAGILGFAASLTWMIMYHPRPNGPITAEDVMWG